MNILLYGIIITAALLFVLIILLIISLVQLKAGKQPRLAKRCPTCGQILEPEWNRCPFCTESEEPRTFPTTATIPELPPIGYLIVKSGADRGKVYKIEKESINIGSGNYNDIIINDNSVSPQHAKIWTSNKRFFIADLHSQAGTKVNNKIIEQSEIYDNDVITIGENIFVFKVLE